MLHNILIWTGIPFVMILYISVAVGVLVCLVRCAKKMLLPAINEYKISKEYRRLAKMSYDLCNEANIVLMTSGNDYYGLRTAQGLMKSASSALSIANKTVAPIYECGSPRAPVVEDIEPPNGDAWDDSERTRGSEDLED
ncbi:hypothetical protein [uncultured Duncaniella sp.]|uniref:hypothetical protein n=1 Tax=uncultured Duncaniella sp. TaxID=2768039 RepID=UPI00262E8A4F|nr:hypothetical protein [uncultured Duncaniella sp.]